MALTRPLVSVYSTERESEIVSSFRMPRVFVYPLRPDLVRFVQNSLERNRRQPHGVALNAGYQTSAESWGTGRAVSRIPRVPGGGTHRAGQAAFGNMCRGGGMFAPKKIWKRIHRRVNLKQKRHAVVSAIAASAIPSLVMARGHKVEEVPEFPLVVEDKLQAILETKKAVEVLKTLGCEEELERVKNSKRIRVGKGKLRNRKYEKRLGPLIIYKEDSGLTKSFRNIPGVDLCHVSRLNLLTLAPGGTLGRLVIWSASAFGELQILYGLKAVRKGGPSGEEQPVLDRMKKKYNLPIPMMANADISRIINSDEIQTAVRPCLSPPKRAGRQFNPLKNFDCLCRLNPAAAHLKQLDLLSRIPGTRQYEVLQSRKRKKAHEERQGGRKINRAYYKDVFKAFSDKKDVELEKKKEAAAKLAAAPTKGDDKEEEGGETQ